jgi:hypothetical protein
MPRPVGSIETDRSSCNEGGPLFALGTGFVVSVVGFACFTAWLIHEDEDPQHSSVR